MYSELSPSSYGEITMGFKAIQIGLSESRIKVYARYTRVETINTLMSWIAECNDRVLWCSGLAGTGKSRLVGTLHKLLSIHMGIRSRLAAFIHYDRTEYLHSSRLITFIAYFLGIFDQRIG